MRFRVQLPDIPPVNHVYDQYAINLSLARTVIIPRLKSSIPGIIVDISQVRPECPTLTCKVSNQHMETLEQFCHDYAGILKIED